MSLYGVMRTGVSGMSAQSNKLSTVSDNIANVNTTGYKRASTEFSSLILKSGSGNYDSGAVETTVRYAISDAGREYLAQHQAAADSILSQLEHIARRLGRMREAFSGFEEDEESGNSKDLWQARRDIKDALRAVYGASEEEKSRVAAILKDAAARIRGKS